MPEASTKKRFNPMPPPPTNNVYRVKFYGKIEEQTTVNTFHYRDDKGILTGTYDMCARLFQALNATGLDLVQAYTEVMSTAFAFERVTIELVTDPTVLVHETAMSAAGVVVGLHMPTQVAVTINRYSLWRGQRGRGRISVPGVPATWVTNSVLTTDSNYEPLRAAMGLKPALAGDVWTPVILSQAKDPITEEVFYGIKDQVAVVTMSVVGTCRKRKLGVGY